MTAARLVLLFATVGVASALGVAFLRWQAHRLPLDTPNARSSHVRPTPRGGGLPIVLAGLVAAALLFTPAGGAGWSFVAGAAVIAAVSWIDDVRGIGSIPRLVVHLAAAAAVAMASPAIASGSPFARLAVMSGALIWIAGVTNAFNFMDGIDGIAGTQALFAGIAWVAIARMEADAPVTLFATVVSGAAAGFLLHNWPPARIFMGDVGSAFLGFTFAAIPLLAQRELTSQRAAAALLVLWPFLFDTGFTILRRLRRGENILRAHRSHLYQRLVISGLSHRSVTLIYGLGAATGGALALAVTREWIALAFALGAVGVMILSLLYFTVSRERLTSPAVR